MLNMSGHRLDSKVSDVKNGNRVNLNRSGWSKQGRVLPLSKRRNGLDLVKGEGGRQKISPNRTAITVNLSNKDRVN